MGLSRFTFILALGASFLAAAPTAPLPPSSPGDASATVTVTAEASPIDLIKTPNPVRVLDKAAIEASGAQTLGDLLGTLFPGQLHGNGGVGTVTSLMMGGARNQDVLVTLDGIRLTDASGPGGVSLNTLGLAGIDRVEVQIGPCSSRSGSDAMGGVVALTTSASAKAGLSGEVKAGIGTQGIREGSFAPAYGWDGGWVRAELRGSQEEQATPTDNPFQTTGVYLGASQALGQDSVVNFSYRNTYTGTPTPYTDTSSSPRLYDASSEEKVRNQQIIGTLRSALSPDWMLDLTLGQALSTRQEPNYLAPGYTAYDSRRDQAVGHLGWTPRAGLAFGWSLDAYKEFASTPDYAGGDDLGQGHHLGTALEGSWEPQAWLRFTGSVREQWDQQEYVVPAGAQAVPDDSTHKTTYKLGVNALLGSGYRVYASGGSGYSLPLLYSVMYNAMNGGTTALQNEQSTFARVGADWTQGPWTVRVEASRTHFSNLIYFDLNSYVYDNGSDMRIQGLETSVAYKAAKWGAEGFWRNQEAREMDLPAAEQLTSSAVVRRPFNVVGAKAWRVLGAWRLDAHWSWTGSDYENYGYGIPIAASRTHFNDLGLGAAWAYSAALSFSLKAEHLLQPRLTEADWLNRTTDGQNDASQIYGFPAQPPTLTLELRYRF